MLDYTPSTTGMPKGVEITHRNIISNASQVNYLNGKASKVIQSPRWLCILPMYHAYGQNYFAILAPMRQIPTYILYKFEFLLFLDSIQKFRITSIAGVPAVMVALAKHPDVVKYDLSSVMLMGCGAAPLSGDIARLVEERVSRGREKVFLKQGWGMTEYVTPYFHIFNCLVTIYHFERVTDGCGRVKSNLFSYRFPPGRYRRNRLYRGTVP